MARKAQNLIGKKYGLLEVISKDDMPGSYWSCQCDCGDMRTVRSDRLKSGKVKTCGKCPNPYDKKANCWTIYLRTGSMGGSTILSEEGWTHILVNCRFTKTLEGFHISYNVFENLFFDSPAYKNLQEAVEHDMFIDIQQSIIQTIKQVTT